MLAAHGPKLDAVKELWQEVRATAEREQRSIVDDETARSL
jgi:hypothetical protein